MRYAAAILVVTAGLVAGLWLHGIQRPYQARMYVDTGKRVRYVGPNSGTALVTSRYHPRWADLAAVAAIGTSLALGAVIITFRR